ncbi:MAG TPA: MATE family efflux transporter [Rudaea sp.]|jgi:MATE family multidrug resistance protein
MAFILRKDAARWRRELRETFILATPLILGQLSSIGMNVIDTLLAGHLDARTLAAVAIGTGLWSLAIVAAIGVMLALPPSVAQLSGAGQRERIGPLFRQALWLAFVLGLVLLVLVRHAGVLLGPIGIDPMIAGETRKFLHAIAWGAPALTMYFALRGFSEGIALTRPTMYFGLFGLLLLAPLGYVLMYGKLGLIPRGAQGSGMATATVLWLQVLAFALYLRLRRHYREIAPFGTFEWPHWHAIVALLRVGVPMGVAVLMEAGLFVAAALLIGSLGANSVAGHQIAINVASVAFMVPLGVAMATTVRVGNAVGRGDAEAVRRAGYAGIGATAFTQTVSSLTMALFPLAIAKVYSDDAGVVATAAQLLLLAAIFQFSDGVQVAANGALRGLKDTTVPMAITAFAYWGIGMPVGWGLAFHAGFGARGMWMGLIAGLTVAAGLLFLRFTRMAPPRHA